MGLSAKSLAGPGYIILNTIRWMNVIALGAVIGACVGMLIKTVKETQFFFFDAVTHAFTIIVCTFLIASEVPGHRVIRDYFTRSWPLLTAEHSFVTLGVAMFMIGIDLLAKLNRTAMSQEHLGMAFWRLIIAASTLELIMGVANVIASYVFCDRESGVTARQVRAKGAVALTQQQLPKAYSWSPSSSPQSDRKAAFSPRTEEKRMSIRFFPFRKTNDASARPPSSHYSSTTEGKARVMEISGPLNINPQFAHLIKPGNTYHPSDRV